jgi:hypothetical protein
MIGHEALHLNLAPPGFIGASPDHLLLAKEIMAGVRLEFSDLYRELEASKDPSSVLDLFLGGLPAAKKPH